MKKVLTLVIGGVVLALAPLPCAAQWGWPPPGYSTAAFVAPDGSRYRRLCEVLRQRRCRQEARGDVACTSPGSGTAAISTSVVPSPAGVEATPPVRGPGR